MNKENIPVITDREKLYDKCENMEQLFDKYYLPLLDKHYSKTYELQQENKQLKEEKQEWINLLDMFKNQQKEFISYLENEKDRLARELSQIYEDSLGKTRLVSEDIFNEVDTILSKYQEIIGGK